MRHRKISFTYKRELIFAGMHEQQMIRQMLQEPAIKAHILSKVLFQTGRHLLKGDPFDRLPCRYLYCRSYDRCFRHLSYCESYRC